ncbi:2-polyprenyl-6-methoxyphenol hydroxylase-like oxidoreductase [Flammeovirgaceae bacterium 311]|nr:2-polyprenyl-6-methoxyphenol hydroxylase-like oxidoreductase [Flammeovirgaceae bacterium 311]
MAAHLLPAKPIHYLTGFLTNDDAMLDAEDKAVLIVGAGPTGLTMANLLARMEVPFMLIDKAPHPSRESKAFGVHARSLEIFHQLGIAHKAVEAGNVDNTVHMLSREKEIAAIRVNKILPGKTMYPYFLVLPQNKLEELLVDSLHKYDEKIYWQHRLTGIREEQDYLLATIEGVTGEVQELKFSYLLGCDGASSLVREQGGFKYKGKTFSPTFYLADAELDWRLPHGDIYFTIAPGHLSIIFSFREKNKYRIFNFLNTLSQKPEENISGDQFQEILDTNPYLEKQLKQPDWLSVYKIHARITDQFQKGNIFLAGDAAHVHSPVGGQGMNTGIQDAYNLAWKLKLVLRGLVSPALLASYHEERYTIARTLHNTTDRYFQLMISRGRASDFFRLNVFPRLFQLVTKIGWIRNKVFMRVSQLAIHYKSGSLSKASPHKQFFSNGPKAGERAPYVSVWHAGRATVTHALLRCTHFTLFVVANAGEGEPACTPAEVLKADTGFPLDVFKLHARENKLFMDAYGVKSRAMFLIRPDGHIAYKSSRIEFSEIRKYLEQLSLDTFQIK